MPIIKHLVILQLTLLLIYHILNEYYEWIYKLVASVPTDYTEIQLNRLLSRGLYNNRIIVVILSYFH